MRKPLTPKQRSVLRAAKTSATHSTGMGGLKKERRAPAPVTLPKLKCIEEDDGDGDRDAAQPATE